MEFTRRTAHASSRLDVHRLPQRLADVPPDVRVLQWEQAIRNKSVMIDLLADAHARSVKAQQDAVNALIAGFPAPTGNTPLSTPEHLQRLSEHYLQAIACLYYVALVRIFERQYGKILRVAHVLEPEACFAVLTKSGEVLVSGTLLMRPDLFSADERNVFLDCLLLSREVRRVVRFPQGRQTCGDAIFSVIATLLNSVAERSRVGAQSASNGHHAPHPTGHVSHADFVRRRYREATALCEQFGKRDAQCIYLYALIILTGLIGAIYYLCIERFWLPRAAPAGDVLIPANCAFAGAVGAAMSMLIRVTRKPLDVSYRTGQVLLILAAFFRPLIGLVFAFLIYAFIQGKLSPAFINPPTGADPNFFYIAIGFVAGFSERLVPRLIASTEGNPVGEHVSPEAAKNNGQSGGAAPAPAVSASTPENRSQTSSGEAARTVGGDVSRQHRRRLQQAAIPPLTDLPG